MISIPRPCSQSMAIWRAICDQLLKSVTKQDTPSCVNKKHQPPQIKENFHFEISCKFNVSANRGANNDSNLIITTKTMNTIIIAKCSSQKSRKIIMLLPSRWELSIYSDIYSNSFVCCVSSVFSWSLVSTSSCLLLLEATIASYHPSFPLTHCYPFYPNKTS